jgi:hypothetical protein
LIQLQNTRHSAKTFQLITAMLLRTLRRVGGEMVPDVSMAKRVVVEVVRA